MPPSVQMSAMSLRSPDEITLDFTVGMNVIPCIHVREQRKNRALPLPKGEGTVENRANGKRPALEVECWPHAYRQQEPDEMENTLSCKALGTAHPGDTNFLTTTTVEE